MIRFRGRKRASEEHDADNFGQKDFYTANTFSGKLSFSNVEEDPFAKDFKEDKFIDQII